MEPFGYINRTILVSNIDTNNPFFRSPRPNACRDPIFVPATSTGNRTRFGNHAFVELNAKIYDACAGPQKGTNDRTGYINTVIDGTPSIVNIQAGNISGVE
jgi:hypothetical protein